VVKGDGLLQSVIERVALKGTVTILGAFTREWWLSLFANGANHPVLELHHGLLGRLVQLWIGRLGIVD